MKEIKYIYVDVTVRVCISTYEDDKENSIRGLKPDFVSTVGDYVEWVKVEKVNELKV